MQNYSHLFRKVGAYGVVLGSSTNHSMLVQLNIKFSNTIELRFYCNKLVRINKINSFEILKEYRYEKDNNNNYTNYYNQCNMHFTFT